MPAAAKVFVCSTYRDLVPEREAVLTAITRLQLQHDSMEFFGARPDVPLATCLEEVRSSDVLVVIVGHKYGSLVPGTQFSYSETEYNEGYSLGKPCLPYIKDDNIPILPRFMETDGEKMKALNSFKKRLHDRHTVATFQSAQDLAVSVAADLGRTIQALESDANTPNRHSATAESTIPEIQRILQDAISREVSQEALLSAVRSAVSSLLASEGKRQQTVYLSFAQSDVEKVRPVAAQLRNAGMVVYPTGDPTSTEQKHSDLDSVISEADSVVFFISKNTLESPWAQKELDQAIQRRIQEPRGPRLIPVKLDNTRIPALLRDIHYIDMSRFTRDEAMNQLLSSVESAVQFHPARSKAG